MLFCRFCEHSVDFTRVDTVKDHLKSKKHAAKKEARKAKNSSSDAPSTSRQMTLGTVVKSRDLRAELLTEHAYNIYTRPRAHALRCVTTIALMLVVDDPGSGPFGVRYTHRLGGANLEALPRPSLRLRA